MNGTLTISTTPSQSGHEYDSKWEVLPNPQNFKIRTLLSDVVLSQIQV